MKLIDDTLKNPDGTWSSLRLMRNACFVVGLVGAIMQYHDPTIPESAWMSLILLGYGSHTVQAFEKYNDRRTKDANGHELMQSGTTNAPETPVIPAADTESGLKL